MLISTDHSSYDYQFIVDNAQLVIDTRNATAGVKRGAQEDRQGVNAGTLKLDNRDADRIAAFACTARSPGRANFRRAGDVGHAAPSAGVPVALPHGERLSLNVTLVNPFDPLPGDDVRPGRYAAFARALADAGHAVTWCSSDFSHTLKRSRDIGKIQAACKAAGFDVHLVETLPYPKNVCGERLKSHRKLARDTAALLAAAEPAADVVVVSAPPPSLAAAVTDAAHARGARVILDVQDLWPETFTRVMPLLLRPLAKLALRPMAKDMAHAESAADAGIAVAEGYSEHFTARAKAAAQCTVLHLGVDLEQFDRNAAAALPAVPEAAADKRWIFCGGMVGTALHWPFLLDLAAELASAAPDVHIMIAGTGPAEGQSRRPDRTPKNSPTSTCWDSSRTTPSAASPPGRTSA